MNTTIKVRVDTVNAQHVGVTVFAGRGTLANCGSLKLAMGEYQLLGAALSMGAEKMPGHLTVVHDDIVFQKWRTKR